MKNIINYDIDFTNIPVSVKKYLYIHDDICKKIPINTNSNKENLCEIKNYEILCEPFWLDDNNFSTWDEELDYLLNLEWEEIKKYVKNNPNFSILVRKKVKEKLLKVNEKLKSKGYILSIKIWYRPFEVQKRLFKKIYEYFQKKFLQDSKESIYNKTIEMISDPNKYISPHLTWWAVDVILYDKNWKVVDMWCPINYIWEKANLTTTEITDTQRKNRDILIDNFLEEWFAPLASEWWHFSYWDQYWAKFYWKKEALYWVI